MDRNSMVEIVKKEKRAVKEQFDLTIVGTDSEEQVLRALSDLTKIDQQQRSEIQQELAQVLKIPPQAAFDSISTDVVFNSLRGQINDILQRDEIYQKSTKES